MCEHYCKFGGENLLFRQFPISRRFHGSALQRIVAPWKCTAFEGYFSVLLLHGSAMHSKVTVNALPLHGSARHSKVTVNVYHPQGYSNLHFS
jgi:hypothetical protein